MSAEDDLKHLVRWLAKYQQDLNDLRMKLIGDGADPAETYEALFGHWPMVQGTPNVIRLHLIAEQPIDNDAVARALKAMDAPLPDPKED